MAEEAGVADSLAVSNFPAFISSGTPGTVTVTAKDPAGNVVTVEPGIYLEGRAGIRVEDNVVVRDGGVENFTGFRKDLINVG